MLDEPSRVLAAAARPPSTLSAAALRSASQATAASLPAGPPVAASIDTEVIGDDGFRIPVRVLIPHGAVERSIVYFHGGGWVVGGIADRDALGRHVAVHCAAAVVIVGYRKAPEHPYPAALDDGWSVLRWAAGGADALLASPLPPLVVAGDSAGGNIAAALTQRAARHGSPRLAAQILVYPVVDDDMSTTSYTDDSNQLLLTRRHMEFFLGAYLPDPALRADPGALPARAADVAGVCPAIVATAEHDVLRDEGECYAARLGYAGVDVRHRTFVGQMHGFFPLVGLLPAAQDALQWVADALDELVPRGGPH